MNEKSEDIKKDLIGHFVYQVNMMRRCFYRAMKSSFFTPDQNSVDEDLMVAFLVHIRVFYYFFFGSNNKDEAYARDYILDWKIENPEMKRWCQQINSYLSHLDYERAKGERGYKPYQILKLYTYFRTLLIDFTDRLPKEFITPELAKQSEILKKEIG